MAAIYSLYIINKSGGLIFCKDYGSAGKMDTNDSLRLASLWHSMHAISQQLSPVNGCAGIELLQADTFDLHCFQSLTGGRGDSDRIFRLILAVYHPRNRYLLHIGADGSEEERWKLGMLVKSVPVIQAFGNVDVVGKPDSVTYMGSTIIAAMLRAVSILLKVDGGWDWFVILSASNYPLITRCGTDCVHSTLPDPTLWEYTRYIVVIECHLSGTKFFVVCEPGSLHMESLLKYIYELYADYVLKNPFYEMEMPIRCELFDINLSQAVQKDRVALLGR